MKQMFISYVQMYNNKQVEELLQRQEAEVVFRDIGGLGGV